MDKIQLHRKLRLRAALFSCHEKTREQIQNNLQNTIISDSSTHFHAYLCDYPVSRFKLHNHNELNNLIDPFIDRGIFENKVIINTIGEPENKIKKTIDTVLNNINKNKNPFEKVLKYSKKSKIYEYWENINDLGPISNGTHASSYYDKWLSEEFDFSIANKPFTAKDCIEDMKCKLSNQNCTLKNKLAFLNQFLLQYRNLLLNQNNIDCLFFVSTPIQTSNTFYGLIIATIECPDGIAIWKNNKIEVQKALSTVKEHLSRQAINIYLPTLILTQNSWEEYLIDDFLKNLEDKNNCVIKDIENEVNLKKDYIYSYEPVIKFSTDACAKKNLTNHKTDEPNTLLENKLTELWQNRVDSLNRKSDIEKIRNSLKFKKMMIASPGLITVVRQIILLNLTEPTEAPFPSLLIYAPPGAGKENISRILPLFSEFFWDKSRITLNMGSIMLELNEPGGIKSLLSKLSNSKDLSEGAIIVLDELNSLDIKEQPILLRILEQGELESIIKFDAHKRNKELPKWLFIGIINEEPEKLTLENLRENMHDNSFFGQFLSVAFYEYFKERSRLRDDIYYRIKRSGEIKLKGLNDRREDIPIIFYFMLRNFLNESNGNIKDIFLTLEAYNMLIDKGIDWKGNIRKLESFVRLIKSKIEEQNYEEEVILIESNMIRGGMQSLI